METKQIWHSGWYGTEARLSIIASCMQAAKDYISEHYVHFEKCHSVRGERVKIIAPNKSDNGWHYETKTIARVYSFKVYLPYKK